jgi:hypothetical protein
MGVCVATGQPLLAVLATLVMLALILTAVTVLRRSSRARGVQPPN